MSESDTWVPGPHLLGRKPKPPDDRDYQLEDYLDARAAADVGLTPDTKLGDINITGWADWISLWHWFKENVMGHRKPEPVEPVSSGNVLWPLGPISDQGDTPHCVGFTGLDWANALPINDNWPNQVGHDIYYECKVLDGEPGVEDGSDSRSLCRALRNRGRIGSYAATTSVDTIRAYVREHGPVGIGIPWDNNMFRADKDGYVRPGGGEAGGHELMVSGHLPNGKGATKAASFAVPNHWGTGWADGGVCYMTETDLQALLNRQGDAWAGLERPLG